MWRLLTVTNGRNCDHLNFDVTPKEMALVRDDSQKKPCRMSLQVSNLRNAPVAMSNLRNGYVALSILGVYTHRERSAGKADK